ncbi:hypothetical protein [Pseudonocardia sp. GCM10023141]|uniref:hypothetical protein n=1 Tax=Pseudonocardia sp. GCM10023141 TaxID=3252653 RepID=UPI0036177E32
MDREYLDEALRRLATDADYRPEGWDDVEIADYRLLVQCARAAQGDADLRNMRVLRLRPDDGSPEVARARLGAGRVIVLRFKSSDGHVAVTLELPTTKPKASR